MTSAAAALQRDITFLRTERLLFLMHYRRLVFSLLLFCSALYFPLLLVARTLEHFRNLNPRDIDAMLNFLCMGLPLGIALPVGTAAFSRAFKEQNVLFFHALPISRTRQWMVLMASSFAAQITAMLFLWILRPSAPAQVQVQSIELILSMVVITFAAGACFALAFLRPIEVYVGGYLLTFILFLGAIWAMTAPGLIYYTPRLQMRSSANVAVDAFSGNLQWTPPLAVLPLIGILFLALFLIASHQFYVRGEITLMRNRIRYPIIVAVIGVVIDTLLVPVLIYGYEVRQWGERRSVRLSPDGRYIAIHTYRDHAEWIGKMRIVDTLNDHTLAQFDGPGISDFWFVGDRLATVARDMAWYRRLPGLSPRDKLDLLTPEGKRMSAIALDAETVVDTARISPTEAALGLRREDDV